MKKKYIIALVGAIIIVCVCLPASFYGVYSLIKLPQVQSLIEGVREPFSALLDIQSKLSAEYPDSTISVRLNNGKYLQVNMINSSANDLSKEQQQEKAKEITQFIMDNYIDGRNLEVVTITFTRQINIAFFNAHSSVSYSFEVNKAN